MRWWNDVGDAATNEGSNWVFESLAEVGACGLAMRAACRGEKPLQQYSCNHFPACRLLTSWNNNALPNRVLALWT
jgi:pyruvate/2-oxoglutarate/acetoin dehydrogenase E1 component